MLGGIFLSFYVDTGVDTELTASDPRWIGNWWIGNVIGVIMAIFLAVWMLGFPRRIPRKYGNSGNSLGSQNNGSDESNVSVLLTVISKGIQSVRSIRDDPYWTSRKNSLELIELSSINKVSLV